MKNKDYSKKRKLLKHACVKMEQAKNSYTKSATTNCKKRTTRNFDNTGV